MSLSPVSKITIAVTSALAAAAVIFTISPMLSSGDGEAHAADCTVNHEALQAIVPLETPNALADVTFFKPDGSEATMADYDGKGVVLNFWATWCAPCVREMPELDRIKAELADDGIEVLAVSTDRGGHNDISQFYERTNIENLAALHDPRGAASRALGVRGLPTTLIVNGDGLEVARIQGIHHYDTPETKDYLRRCIGTVHG